jgi:hypothetical protein
LHFFNIGKQGYCQMRCSPGIVRNIINEMSDQMKRRIEDAGFMFLLGMNIDKLEDIVFNKFLMDNIREDLLRIEVGTKKIANNCTSCAHCVWATYWWHEIR